MTRDDDGSNLNKFLGKVEYLLKLCFTNAVTCFGPAEYVQIQTAYCTKGWQNCCIGNFLSFKYDIVACKYLYVET